MAMAWAPNNSKLAICGQYRNIFVFDENGQLKEKFPAKSAENLNAQGPDGVSFYK
jgi:intraflagellar transport protein 172